MNPTVSKPSVQTRLRTSKLLHAAAMMLATGCFAGTAAAQFGRPSPQIVLRNARILTMSGPAIESGSVVISGGTIVQIGKEVRVGPKAIEYDLKGMTITPGLIDVDGSLGMSGIAGSRDGPANADPLNRAFDAFDRYALDVMKDAVRHGVTAVAVTPRTGSGIVGTTALIRLEPGDGPWAGKAVTEDAALCVDMGSGEAPTQRLGTLERIRRQFKGAVEYRESVETYKEELEEYEKKIKERAEKTAKEEGKDSTAKGAPGAKPDGKPGEKLDAKPGEKGDAGKPTPPTPTPPTPTPPTPTPPTPKSAVSPSQRDDEEGVESTGGLGRDGQNDEQMNDGGAAQPDPRPRRRPPGGGGGGGGGGGPPPEGGRPAAPAGDTGGDAKDDIKKPTEPSPDRSAEVLLKAIDREMPVFFRCQRSEDILNALELAKEFNLRCVIEGGAESHLVAGALAKAKADVVLTSAIGRDYYRGDDIQRRDAGVGGALSARGVHWYVGTGARPDRFSSSASRFVLLSAQVLAQGDPKVKDPLRRVTADAADFLGADSKCGRLRPGMPADVVVWGGDPLDPGSTVKFVYVGGELVYQSDDAPDEAPPPPPTPPTPAAAPAPDPAPNPAPDDAKPEEKEAEKSPDAGGSR